MEFAKKLIDATEEIFNTMVFMPIKAEEPLQQGEELLDCHISAMIGLSGDFNSMLSIHCPSGIASSITEAMLGMDVEELGDDVKDTIGEISNMIAGGIKTAFSEENVRLELAIPTTVTGHSYRVKSPTNSSRTVIPFEIEQGRFFVEIKYSLN